MALSLSIILTDSYSPPVNLPDSYFKRDKIHPNFNGTKKLLSNIDRLIKVIKPGNYGQTSQPSNYFQTHGSRPDSYFGRPVGQAPQRSSRGPRSVKFCHICFRQGGHTTQECWFNGRTTGVPARPSRLESAGRIKSISSCEPLSDQSLNIDQPVKQTNFANIIEREESRDTSDSSFDDNSFQAYLHVADIKISHPIILPVSQRQT